MPSTAPNASNQDSITQCSPGHWCDSGLRFLCPPGVYGAVSGLGTAACSGLCWAGYYCRAGSTTPVQAECAQGAASPASVYCPIGSGAPLVALPGEETRGSAPRTRSLVRACASGSYCVNGTAMPCAAGRFGCADRLSDPGCNGPCSAGFACPLGSVSGQAYVRAGKACCGRLVLVCVCRVGGGRSMRGCVYGGRCGWVAAGRPTRRANCVHALAHGCTHLPLQGALRWQRLQPRRCCVLLPGRLPLPAESA
jgi:hypothetical protein